MKKITITTAAWMVTAVLLCGCSASNAGTGTSEAEIETSKSQTEAGDASEAPKAGDGTEKTGISAEEVSILLGSTEDKVYQNRYFGYQFTLPDEFAYSDETALISANSFNADTSFSNQAGSVLGSTGNPVIVMAAEETGSAAYDGVDNLSVEVINAGEEITDDQYDSLLANALSAVTAQYSGDGTAKVETESFSFAGATRKGIRFTAEKDGIQVYERIIFIPEGQYLSEVTIGTLDESRLDSIQNLFTDCERAEK